MLWKYNWLILFWCFIFYYPFPVSSIHYRSYYRSCWCIGFVVLWVSRSLASVLHTATYLAIDVCAIDVCAIDVCAIDVCNRCLRSVGHVISISIRLWLVGCYPSAIFTIAANLNDLWSNILSYLCSSRRACVQFLRSIVDSRVPIVGRRLWAVGRRSLNITQCWPRPCWLARFFSLLWHRLKEIFLCHYLSRFVESV